MTKISELTAVTSLSTSDTIVVVQGTTTMKATLSQLPSSGGGGTSSGTSVDITNAPYSVDKTGANDVLSTVRTAVSSLSTFGGGTIIFPAGTYKFVFADQSGSNPDSSLTIPANVVLAGVGASTILNITCSNGSGTGFLFCFKFAGNRPGFRNFKMQRGNIFDGVFLTTGTSDNAFVENVEFDGKIGTYATNYIHALYLGSGNLTNFRWIGGKSHHLTYSLLQPSPATGSTVGFLVDRVEFYANTATDLEFNAPHSVMTGIVIQNCYAHDQDVSASSGGWFFAGFARCGVVKVHDNRVENYRGEPIHVEDGSYDVDVHDNTFVSCALGSGLSYFQVISYSSRVWIHHNRFDAVANASVSGNYPYLIGLQAGGAPGTTDGGNPFVAPYEIMIDHNQFQCQTANGIYVENNARTKIDGNRFKGNGSIDGSGNFIGSNAGWGIDFYGGGGVEIVNNYFEGIMYGIRPRQPGEGANTGAASSIVAQNNFINCKYAMVLANPEFMNINNNIVSTCEFPLITGQAAYTSKMISVVGNSAKDCKWPMNFNGKYTVVANASRAVGSGVTLSINPTFINIPSGVAFTFSNGAVFTTTSSTAASPSANTTLTGNATVATIASGAGGTSAFGSIPHSSDSVQNHVLASANLDSVAGIYA